MVYFDEVIDAKSDSTKRVREALEGKAVIETTRNDYEKVYL
jgi:hypothetical protein